MGHVCKGGPRAVFEKGDKGEPRWNLRVSGTRPIGETIDPMRLLFTSFPAYGHLHPLAPLALAARDAGHDVRLAIGPDLVRWAKSCGIDAYPVGLGFDDVHQLARSRYPGDDWDMHMFTDIWVRAALPDLLASSATWQPELVVHEELECAGVLLATILGIPCVTHSWHAPVRPAASRRSLAGGVDSGLGRTAPWTPSTHARGDLPGCLPGAVAVRRNC